MKNKEDRYKNIKFCIQCGAPMELRIDREEKLRPICSNCGWIYYKNPVTASACVVLNENNEILLIKRKFPPQAGKWALPSGYIEIDQSPELCAEQELFEETNLIGRVDRFLDYYWGDNPFYEKIVSFGFLMKVKGGELRAGDDALEAKYVSLDHLPEIAFDAHKHYIKLATKNIKK